MPDETTKPERRVSTAFGLTFAPWRWSVKERLRPFVGPPFKVERDVSCDGIGVAGAVGRRCQP
jgi:hypothetical protein